MQSVKSFDKTPAEKLKMTAFAKELAKTKQKLVSLDQVIQCSNTLMTNS